MRGFRFVTLTLILGLVVAGAQCTYGAAQLKSGAKTSAKPTSTNPEEREIQITFDPAASGSSVVQDPGYDVDAFQLSVSYDATLMTLQDVNLVTPFQNPVAGGGVATLVSPDDTPATGYVNDPVAGIISYIAGTASSQTAAGPGDVNIFTADFILDPGVSFDQPLAFSLYANGTDGDFIEGYDPFLASSLTWQAAGITPTVIAPTFNEAPEPTVLALGALAAFLLGSRRKRSSGHVPASN